MNELFPMALCGAQSVVKRRVRKAVQAVINGSDWTQAFDEWGWQDVAAMSEKFLLQGPQQTKQEFAHVYRLPMSIFDVAYETFKNADDVNAAIKRIVLLGSPIFWFNICFLGGEPGVLIDAFNKSHVQFFRSVLRGMNAHLPALKSLEDRYMLAETMSGAWPFWITNVFSLCAYAQPPENELAEMRFNYTKNRLTIEKISEYINRWTK